MQRFKNFVLGFITFLTIGLSTSDGQLVFTNLNSSTPNNTGLKQLNTLGQPSTANFFYMFGDGFFSPLNAPIRQYRSTAVVTGYTGKSYVLNAYGTQPPPALSANTGSLRGPKVTPNYSFPSNPHVGLSWNPSNQAANFYILKVKPPRGASCVSFYYNSNQVIIDGTILDQSNDWFNTRTTTTISNGAYNTEVKWNINADSLKQDSVGIIYLPLRAMGPIGSTINIGSSYCSSIINHQNFAVASAPYDPNSIEVDKDCFFYSPLDAYNPMNTTQNAGRPYEIKYKVKFFNKGNGPAQNVKINIPLDAGIDPSSIQILDSEYPCTKSIAFNTLILTFNNINLPGISQTNPIVTYDEAESWVRFKVCSQNVLAPICINHFADIYFDLLPPIRTNTASTCTFCSQNNGRSVGADLCSPPLGHRSTGLSNKHLFEPTNISVFPNPVQNNITFMSENTYNDVTLNITNSTGQLVKKETIDTLENGSAIDVSELSAGIYFIQVKNQDILKTIKIVKE